MFTDSITNDIISTIIVSALAFTAGIVIRRFREYTKIEKQKLTIIKLTSLPGEAKNSEESYYFHSFVMSSRPSKLPPVTFGSSGDIHPYQTLPEAGRIQGINPFDYRQKKSFRVAHSEKCTALGLAGYVKNANEDESDHWFGTTVLGDRIATTLIVDFSSIKNAETRIINCRASYWQEMDRQAATNPVTLDKLPDNVYIAKIDSEDAKEHHILKIEFELKPD